MITRPLADSRARPAITRGRPLRPAALMLSFLAGGISLEKEWSGRAKGVLGWVQKIIFVISSFLLAQVGRIPDIQFMVQVILLPFLFRPREILLAYIQE